MIRKKIPNKENYTLNINIQKTRIHDHCTLVLFRSQGIQYIIITQYENEKLSFSDIPKFITEKTMDSIYMSSTYNITLQHIFCRSVK